MSENADPMHRLLDLGWIFGLVIFMFSLVYLIGLYMHNTNIEYQRPGVESFMDLNLDDDDDHIELTDEELLEWYV